MNIEFEKHIIDLLKNNQCVILPGFGGLILKSVPSSIHLTTIFPPSKQIAFNSSLVHDDELLTAAVMNYHTLSYQEAKSKVISYANHLNYTLRKEQHVSLKQIGSFTIGVNNQIVFKPFISNVVDKEAFGLNQFHIKPLAKTIIAQKQKTSSNAFVESVRTERKVKIRKKLQLPALGLVSAVFLMAGVFGLMATNTTFPTSSTHQAGFVDMLFPNDTFIKSFDNSIEVYSEAKINPSDQKEGYKTGSLISIYNQDLAEGYYIVVGAYTSLRNAERMEAGMFAQGYDTYILPSEEGLYRVCRFADQNLLDAKTILSKQSIKDAWLLKNKKSV
jgi:nucleoid DNA-binding protein